MISKVSIISFLLFIAQVRSQAGLYQACSSQIRCSAGLTCYAKDQYYSQCLYSCPSGWQCQSLNPTIPASTSRSPVTNQNQGSSFPNCQLKFGTKYGSVPEYMYSQFDYITNWIGENKDGDCALYNNKNKACTDFNNYWLGNMLRKTKELNKVALFYGYIIAFEARVLEGLADCNVNAGVSNLCKDGANFVRKYRDRILERYEHYSWNIANILGNNYPSIFIIEPDFMQLGKFGERYGNHVQQNGGPLDSKYMRQLFEDIVAKIKKNLPNALISWDISPWLSESDMTEYWSYFKDSPSINFINTSGGQNYADSDSIQGRNGGRSWKFMSYLTGKKIIADSGYGVAGNEFNNNQPWYSAQNVDARIRDGVIANTLVNAKSSPNYKPRLC